LITHETLKQGLRLNRATAYSFLFFAISLVFWNDHSLFFAIRLALFSVITLAGILLNEGGIRLLKRFKQIDPIFLEKFSLMIPLASFTATLIGYGLSGLPGAGYLCCISVFQAQVFGHMRLSKIMFTGFILILCAGAYFQFNTPLPQAPLGEMYQLLPLFIVIFMLTTHLSGAVKTTGNQLVKLQSLAATDALTTLINRRQFNHQLQAEVARSRRHRLPLSLALFDIDNFKKINDQFGHPVGDRILKELGHLITQNIRECDVAARYGGEEFALILPETRQTEAAEILERIRLLVEKNVFCLPDTPLTMTISVGVTQYDPDHPSAFEFVEKADAALYEAKNQGKNRVIYGFIPTPKLTFPGNTQYL
jgi:diguanylate cyclase (GGDEF)-like protein